MEPTVTIKNTQTGEVRQVPQSQLGSYGIQPQTQIQPQAPTQPQGGGLGHMLLPLGGSILGSLLGIPLGPAGIIGGGAIGGGIGGALAGENLPDIGKEALFGGIGGLFPAARIGKIAGVGARAAEEAGAQTAERAGSGLTAKTLASNFRIPPKLAPEIGIEDALKQMLNDRITPPSSIKGYQTLANDITGSEGAISKGVRMFGNYIKSPINYDEPIAGAQSLIAKSGSLSAQQKLDAMETIREHFAGRPPIGVGQLSATDAFDVAKGLEGEGNLLKAIGHNELSPRPNDVAVGIAMVGVSEDLLNQIYRAADKEGLLPIIKNSIIKQLGGKYPEIERKVLAATSGEQIRSISAPYVRISLGAQSTINRMQTPFNAGGRELGTRLAGAAAGFGIGHIPGAVVGAMTAPAAAGIAEASQPWLTGLAARGILGGAGAISTFGPTVAGQVGAHALGGLGTPTVPSGPENIGNTQSDQQTGTDIHDQTIAQMSDESQGPITPQDLLRQRLGTYIISRARNVNDLIQGYNLLYPKAGQGTMTIQEKNTLDSQLNKFGKIYNNMNPIQRMNPLDPHNRQLQTIRTLLVAQVRKAMVGGRATQQELIWIMNLLPPLNHPLAAVYPKETVDAAIEQLKSSIGGATPQNLGLPLPANYGGITQ